MHAAARIVPLGRRADFEEHDEMECDPAIPVALSGPSFPGYMPVRFLNIVLLIQQAT